MLPVRENAPHELYSRATSTAKPNGPLKLRANVLGRFTVERSSMPQAVQDRVRDRTRDAEKQASERKTLRIENPADLAPAPAPAPANGVKKRKPEPTIFRKPVAQASAATGSGSRNLSATQASARVPSPRVASPLAPVADTEATNSLRKRLIHFVALHQPNADEVLDRVGGKNCSESLKRQLLDLLDEVSLDCNSS